VSLGPRTGDDARRDSSRARSTPDPALRADLREFFQRWGNVGYLVEDDVSAVVVPDAAGEPQGRRELHLFLDTWRAAHPDLGLELGD
jgi:hypothetical protein